MCARDAQQSNTAADDVWDTDSSEPGSPTAAAAADPQQRGGSQLDREWEARKQQFYNAGFREGLEEGKEVTLQQGFNAGFAEGAQAGYEFGLVKSTLQVLAAHLAEGDNRRAKVQELLQQVSGLSNRTVMIDTCKALLAQQPADVISQHLQAALTLHGQADTASASQATPQSATSEPAADAGASSSSGADAAAAAAAAGEVPLPLQLVSHLRQELQQLGFTVGSAPPLTVASGSPPTAADAGRDRSKEEE